VEKPAVGQAPSNLAIMGRYVLTPGVFEFLEQHEVGSGGEIQLTDAIQKLHETEGVYAYDFIGKRYDVGEKLGFITTIIAFAMMNKELRAPLITAMEEVLASEQRASASPTRKR
jgi:UTP--glucose-1-phosphate uridylyltransferase